MLSELILLVYV